MSDGVPGSMRAVTARFLTTAGCVVLGVLCVSQVPRMPQAAAQNTPKAANTAPSANTTDAETQRRAQVVASFQGGEVTTGELEDAIRKQSPQMRRRYLDPAVKRDLLDKTVRFELLADAADKRGYGANEAVQQTVKQNSVQTLMKEELDDKITLDQVPAEDVKQYYETNLAEFVRPAVRRVSHIMVATQEEAQAVVTEAKDMDMRHFRELARTKSMDEQSNLRGGDLGYFDVKGKLQGEDVTPVPSAIVKAAFALATVGDLATVPAKVDGGYSVVKLTGQRPANERALAAAEGTIRTRLWRERRQAGTEAFVEKLKTEIKPVVRAELLSTIVLPPAAPEDVAPAPGAPEAPSPHEGTPGSP